MMAVPLTQVISVRASMGSIRRFWSASLMIGAIFIRVCMMQLDTAFGRLSVMVAKTALFLVIHVD